MIKLLVKLAIVALLANAAREMGTAYLTWFRFRDDVRQAAIYKAKTDGELMSRIMDLAARYEIPLEQDNVTVSRDERSVTVDGWYDVVIEVVPRFRYPWHFSLAVEVTPAAALGAM